MISAINLIFNNKSKKKEWNSFFKVEIHQSRFSKIHLIIMIIWVFKVPKLMLKIFFLISNISWIKFNRLTKGKFSKKKFQKIWNFKQKKSNCKKILNKKNMNRKILRKKKRLSFHKKKLYFQKINKAQSRLKNYHNQTKKTNFKKKLRRTRTFNI